MKLIQSVPILLIFLVSFLYAQFEDVVQQYDIITTIAGKGDIEDKGVNGWRAEFEGGMAIDAELSRPHFAMADLSGNIFIADKDAHAIRKVTPDGRIFTVAGTSISGYDGDGVATEHMLNAPNGLWVKPDGTFYILDLGNNRIRKVTPDGDMSTLIHDTNGIAIGRGLWVSEDETTVYYAGSSTVKKWTPSEGIITFATGFSQLGNLVIDPKGELVVTDRSANLVYRVSEDGSKTVIAGNGQNSGGGNGYKATETSVYGVRGVWFLPDNSYFLATHEGSQIWYVDNEGIIYLFLEGKEGDEYHTGDGDNFRTAGYKISEARSISVDFQGNILLAENDRGFIRKITKKNDTRVHTTVTEKKAVYAVAYPNPFNPSTTISYDLPVDTYVSLTIFNLAGCPVKSLVDKKQSAGKHTVRFMATTIPSGVYFYQLKTEKFYAVGKITFIQ